jgi:hypothetical protein
MATTVTYKAKWTGADPTMVRCTQLGEKVQVKSGGVVEVDQPVAFRLMREPEWVVEDNPKIGTIEDAAPAKKTSMRNDEEDNKPSKKK